MATAPKESKLNDSKQMNTILKSDTSDTQHDNGASLILDIVDENTQSKPIKSSNTIQTSLYETLIHCTIN